MLVAVLVCKAEDDLEAVRIKYVNAKYARVFLTLAVRAGCSQDCELAADQEGIPQVGAQVAPGQTPYVKNSVVDSAIRIVWA